MAWKQINLYNNISFSKEQLNALKSIQVRDANFPRPSNLLTKYHHIVVKNQTFPSSALSMNCRNFSNISGGGQIHSHKWKNISVNTVFKVKYLSSPCQAEKGKQIKSILVTFIARAIKYFLYRCFSIASHVKPHTLSPIDKQPSEYKTKGAYLLQTKNLNLHVIIEVC